MSTIKRELLPNEQILSETRPHYIVFARGIVWLAFYVAILLFAQFSSSADFQSSGMPSLFKIASWMALALGIIYLIGGAMTYFFTEYVITNRRILITRGMLNRDTREILLQKIEGVDLARNFAGRIFNYGSILVTGVGGTKDSFNYVPMPHEFRKMAQEQIDQLSSNQHA